MLLTKKMISYLMTVLMIGLSSFTTGCASGGFKLTRDLAGWLNRQHIVVRCILYILGSFVFGITLIIDAVVFNTIDFWQGRVSAGEKTFNENGKVYYAKHEFIKGDLKKSTLRVSDSKNKVLEERVLIETANQEIKVYVNGKYKGLVSNYKTAPIARLVNSNKTFVVGL